MARILVTGGAGYIGSHTVALLVEEGHQVTVLDSLEKGHRDAVHAEARLVVADLADLSVVTPLLNEGFDAVLHFAAYIEAGESMAAPERFFVNNTAKSLIFLESLVQAGIPQVVFSSTAATYGDPRYTPIDEAHPKAPTNAYGASKLLVEEALLWLCQQRGLKACALRYFNAAGAGHCDRARLGERHHPETHLIPLILQVALGQREAIYLYGTDYPTPDGTCVRDYIHVTDLARAHRDALPALDRAPRGEFLRMNLGTGQGYSVRAVIEAARAVTGHPIPTLEAPRRPGDPATLIASNALAHATLGWTPRHSDLPALIESAWAFAKSLS